MQSIEDDFELLFNIEKEEQKKVQVKPECAHEEVEIYKNVKICCACGMHTEKMQTNQRMWNGSFYNRRGVKDGLKSLHDDVKGIQEYNFDPRIIDIADDIFKHIQQKTDRKMNARKSVVCACLFEASKILSATDPTTSPLLFETVMKVLKVDKKSALGSLKMVKLKMVNLTMPSVDDSIYTATTPKVFIFTYMKGLEASDKSISQVYELFDKIKDIETVNRSRPQSIASGIIYYWILENRKQIDIEAFSRTTSLSALTISKLEKEFRNVIKSKTN